LSGERHSSDYCS